MSTRSVFCIALSRGRADRIIDALRRAGFSNTELSVVFLDRGTRRGNGAKKKLLADPGPGPVASAVESAGEIRGTMAWIAGIRPLVMAGAVPLIAAGPIGAALDGAIAEGVAVGLVEFGVPREEAGRFEARIKDGHVLISVHQINPDVSDQARDIFTAAGAEEIFTIMQVTSPNISRLDVHRASRVPVG